MSIAGSSIDSVLETSEWQTRKSKRPRHKSTSNSESEASASVKASNECKKGRVGENTNPGHVVFIKVVFIFISFDIAKEASRQPIQFSKRLSCAVGKVEEVKLVNDCVRVTCTSPKQKCVLLQMTD